MKREIDKDRAGGGWPGKTRPDQRESRRENERGLGEKIGAGRAESARDPAGIWKIIRDFTLTFRLVSATIRA